MPDQYRRDYDDEGRRGRATESERGERRGNDRPRAGGDWRGGHSGLWGQSEADDRGYAMSDRGGIRRETGFDRGTSRDERNSRDWQQRVSDDQQGYRTQDRWSDRDWHGEPDWQSDRPRGWQGGRDWSPRSAGREQEPWHQSHEQWRGSHERRGDWDDRHERGRYADRGRPYERGESSDWSHEPRRIGGGERERYVGWSQEFGGDTWHARGEEPDRAMSGARRGEWAWGFRGPSEGSWPGYAGRGPKGYKRSDERIREDVSDRLMEDHDVDASDITIEVKDGEVKLAGTVPDRAQKRRAEELAERIAGVSEVINNLRVNRHWEGTLQPATQAGLQGTSADQHPGGGQRATQGNPAAGQPGGLQQPGRQGAAGASGARGNSETSKS